MGKKRDSEERRSFISSILEKAFGKDKEPEPYEKKVTEEDLKKTEKIVKGIKERIR